MPVDSVRNESASAAGVGDVLVSPNGAGSRVQACGSQPPHRSPLTKDTSNNIRRAFQHAQDTCWLVSSMKALSPEDTELASEAVLTAMAGVRAATEILHRAEFPNSPQSPKSPEPGRPAAGSRFEEKKADASERLGPGSATAAETSPPTSPLTVKDYGAGGDCFFRAVLGMLKDRGTRVNVLGAVGSVPAMRTAMAKKLMNDFVYFNKNASTAKDSFEGREHLLHLSTPEVADAALNKHEPEIACPFHAKDESTTWNLLQPSQKKHVSVVASEGQWNSHIGDYFPSLAVATFPQLGLRISKPGMSDQEFGGPEAPPVHLNLNGDHYRGVVEESNLAKGAGNSYFEVMLTHLQAKDEERYRGLDVQGVRKKLAEKLLRGLEGFNEDLRNQQALMGAGDEAVQAVLTEALDKRPYLHGLRLGEGLWGKDLEPPKNDPFKPGPLARLQEEADDWLQVKASEVAVVDQLFGSDFKKRCDQLPIEQRVQVYKLAVDNEKPADLLGEGIEQLVKSAFPDASPVGPHSPSLIPVRWIEDPESDSELDSESNPPPLAIATASIPSLRLAREQKRSEDDEREKEASSRR